ncbi:hypothetical protein GCM10010149_76390 [Nonomuraea roseoviolacea subsp. roseoviolacea]|uniref:Type II toxin-antitoxin system VapC family toxin n=1 Tax=Nonomuraea roseoviolacea subsp. carminata TaxID=160689 RepID=A0ABT1KCG7_9ACTN|nr:hypothetical protein [Nonomuraea roseoviolacea subsp. carminata]
MQGQVALHRARLRCVPARAQARDFEPACNSAVMSGTTVIMTDAELTQFTTYPVTLII